MRKPRLINWDVLRSLAMFMVVMVHMRPHLGAINGVNVNAIVSTIDILCDPIFFTLSGFFAIKPMTKNLKEYYLGKVSSIILPLIAYSIPAYLLQALYTHGSLRLGAYLQFFDYTVTESWWFIPALIPCLIAAPFISMGLCKMSEKQVGMLGLALMVLYLACEILTSLQWFFAAVDMNGCSLIFTFIMHISSPYMLSWGPAFFQFFVFGGIFRVVAPRLRGKLGNALMGFALLCALLNIIWRLLEIPSADPNYFWLFEVLGIMIAFDRFHIDSKVVGAISSWTGKRSYAIYLIHFSIIPAVVYVIYTMGVFGPVEMMEDWASFGIYIIAVLCVYLLALAAASIYDPLIVNNLQKLFNRIFMNRRKPQPAMEKSDR